MAGPVQVLSEASEFGGAYRLTYCATEPRVRSAQGLILADLEPLPAPREGDLVLVPGISTSVLGHLDGAPSAWLAKAHLAGARIASICSGAFVLARAGLRGVRPPRRDNRQPNRAAGHSGSVGVSLASCWRSSFFRTFP
jgi:transcriptional regulator GlxA family with amidase domain